MDEEVSNTFYKLHSADSLVETVEQIGSVIVSRKEHG